MISINSSQSQIIPHFLSFSNNIITRAHHLYLLREESRKKMRFRNSVQPFLSLLIAAFFIGVALAGKTYENYEKAEKIFIFQVVFLLSLTCLFVVFNLSVPEYILTF